ncbi:MAG: RIP metalloprotease RseP [Methylobacter sp.]|nr:MAG: RIP metalloprotease RseP [Methylobacter sp.]
MHTLIFFIIAISILVSIHEFGHFWVARKMGVKVLRFSIGFGKIIWSYQKQPGATEYVISAIPLGGYVKMVDEREAEVAPEDLPYAFNRQPLWPRIAIVSAGPLFNLLLAVFLFWLSLVIGENGIKPIIGSIEQGSLAASAGFTEGEEIIAINGKTTPTWTEAIGTLISAALDNGQAIDIEVKDLQGRESRHQLKVSEEDTQDPDTLYKNLGLKPWTPKLKPKIGKILPQSAAAEAGLQQGDLILSADGTVLDDWTQWVEYVKNRPEVTIRLVIDRQDVQIPVDITPKRVEADGKVEGKIGAAVLVPEDLLKSITVKYALSPLPAIPAAFAKTWDYSSTTLKMMGKMLAGRASIENLSGPISIAQFAGQSASIGLVAFLKFLGLVSVSLGVLNLLPIPVLDGGHLVFFFIEGIKGSPVSEKIQLMFQQAGMALLVTLMVLAMFMDIGRLFR